MSVDTVLRVGSGRLPPPALPTDNWLLKLDAAPIALADEGALPDRTLSHEQAALAVRVVLQRAQAVVDRGIDAPGAIASHSVSNESAAVGIDAARSSLQLLLRLMFHESSHPSGAVGSTKTPAHSPLLSTTQESLNSGLAWAVLLLLPPMRAVVLELALQSLVVAELGRAQQQLLALPSTTGRLCDSLCARLITRRFLHTHASPLRTAQCRMLLVRYVHHRCSQTDAQLYAHHGMPAEPHWTLPHPGSMDEIADCAPTSSGSATRQGKSAVSESVPLLLTKLPGKATVGHFSFQLEGVRAAVPGEEPSSAELAKLELLVHTRMQECREQCESSSRSDNCPPQLQPAMYLAKYAVSRLESHLRAVTEAHEGGSHSSVSASHATSAPTRADQLRSLRSLEISVAEALTRCEQKIWSQLLTQQQQPLHLALTLLQEAMDELSGQQLLRLHAQMESNKRSEAIRQDALSLQQRAHAETICKLELRVQHFTRLRLDAVERQVVSEVDAADVQLEQLQMQLKEARLQFKIASDEAKVPKLHAHQLHQLDGQISVVQQLMRAFGEYMVCLQLHVQPQRALQLVLRVLSLLESSVLAQLRVGVFGCVNHGKSTLISALVGVDCLPSRDSGMSFLPTRVRHQPHMVRGEVRLTLAPGLCDRLNQLMEAIRSALRSVEAQNVYGQIQLGKRLGVGQGAHPHLNDLLLRLVGREIEDQVPPFVPYMEGLERVQRLLALMHDLERLRMRLTLDVRFGQLCVKHHVDQLSCAALLLDNFDDTPLVDVCFESLRDEMLPGTLVLVDPPGRSEQDMRGVFEPLLEQVALQVDHSLLVVALKQHDDEAVSDMVRFISKVHLKHGHAAEAMSLSLAATFADRLRDEASAQGDDESWRPPQLEALAATVRTCLTSSAEALTLADEDIVMVSASDALDADALLTFARQHSRVPTRQEALNSGRLWRFMSTVMHGQDLSVRHYSSRCPTLASATERARENQVASNVSRAMHRFITHAAQNVLERSTLTSAKELRSSGRQVLNDVSRYSDLRGASQTENAAMMQLLEQLETAYAQVRTKTEEWEKMLPGNLATRLKAVSDAFVDRVLSGAEERRGHVQAQETIEQAAQAAWASYLQLEQSLGQQLRAHQGLLQTNVDECLREEEARLRDTIAHINAVVLAQQSAGLLNDQLLAGMNSILSAADLSIGAADVAMTFTRPSSIQPRRLVSTNTVDVGWWPADFTLLRWWRQTRDEHGYSAAAMEEASVQYARAQLEASASTALQSAIAKYTTARQRFFQRLTANCDELKNTLNTTLQSQQQLQDERDGLAWLQSRLRQLDRRFDFLLTAVQPTLRSSSWSDVRAYD